MFPNTFLTPDGLTLRCAAVTPLNGQSRAKVLIVHGLGDHSRGLPYANLTTYLTSCEMAVYSFDLRGHGHSDGPRMFVNAFADFRRDLRVFVEMVRSDEPDAPLYLFGMSLGGLLVLNYAEHDSDGVDGVVVIAPAVVSSGVPPLVRRIVPILSRLAPRASINPRLDLTHIARDPVSVREYTSDPLFQTRTTPRLAAEILAGMDETRALADRLRLPLLILHGANDTIVPPEGSAGYIQQVASTDSERIVYPDAYHNLLIDNNRDEVMADIGDWIKGRTR